MEDKLVVFVLFFFIASAIISVLAMFFSIALDIVPIWISNIKDFIDEIKRRNRKTNQQTSNTKH